MIEASTITAMGCVTQFFQRHILQRCDEGPVRPMNLLEPALMPVDSISFSVFPAHDPDIAVAAPPLTGRPASTVAAAAPGMATPARHSRGCRRSCDERRT